jgi:hypothetical protein
MVTILRWPMVASDGPYSIVRRRDRFGSGRLGLNDANGGAHRERGSTMAVAPIPLFPMVDSAGEVDKWRRRVAREAAVWFI